MKAENEGGSKAPGDRKLKAVKVDPSRPAMLLTDDEVIRYKAMAKQLQTKLEPRGALEEGLAWNIIQTHWRILRVTSISDSLRASPLKDGADDGAVKAMERAAREFQRLTKMLRGFEGDFERTRTARRENEIARAFESGDQSTLVH